MSFLSSLFGRRPAPPAPPAASAPPASPPLPGDLLVLAGAGLADAALAVSITVTPAGGEPRTFLADAARWAGPGYALSGLREAPVAPEPVAPEPEPVSTEPVAVAPEPVAPAPEPVAAAPAPEAAEPDTDVAVVRLPVTDHTGAVVGYELLPAGDRGDGGSGATARMFLEAFGDVGLERIAGRHAAWMPLAPDFLLEVGTPPVRPDKVVLQLPCAPVRDEVLAALRRLQFSGYALALDGYEGAAASAPLLDVCRIVKVAVAGRTDDQLRALLAEPVARGHELVATGVATPAELARCRALGFTVFQGDFFAQPGLLRQRRVGTGGAASLQALARVADPDVSFEDLESAIGSDVGLSLKLLRYVNSAFFALPRTVESVHEALTLLGTATVRRWATVVALASAADAPEELVELALQRARMCEVLGGSPEIDRADAHFTVGLFSVADALLDAPMDDVLETLPFSDEIRAALLRREGPKGELLSTVMAYERGIVSAAGADAPLAGAYGDAVAFAGDAARAAA